jgi:heme/copper-type cytochrome/quinol oxidase subunit 3
MADVSVGSSWSKQVAPQEPFGTPEEIAYERRAQETAVYVGGKVAIAIFAFAFAALAFSYFYLRSSNSQDMWRPGHMTAPTQAGAAVMAFAAAGGVAFWFGVSRLRRSMFGDWEVAGWVAVVMALASVAVQCWELATLPFVPGRSGYSSVFVAWAGMNIMLMLVVAYWSETLVARSLRLRRGDATSDDAEGGGSVPPVFRVNVGAASSFWIFAVLVSVLFWVFFYQL